MALSVISTPTFVNSELKDSSDKVRYCWVCLAQLRRESRWPLIPSLLRTELIHNYMDFINRVPNRTPSRYMIYHWRSNSSSEGNKTFEHSAKQRSEKKGEKYIGNVRVHVTVPEWCQAKTLQRRENHATRWVSSDPLKDDHGGSPGHWNRRDRDNLRQSRSQIWENGKLELSGRTQRRKWCKSRKRSGVKVYSAKLHNDIHFDISMAVAF